MTFLGDSQFVVDLAQHRAVFQAELVTLTEGRVTHRTREAVHVEHQVTRPHHHFGEQDGGLAPGAALHPEQPAKQQSISCNTKATKLLSSSVFTQPRQLITLRREIKPNYYLDKLLTDRQLSLNRINDNFQNHVSTFLLCGRVYVCHKSR